MSFFREIKPENQNSGRTFKPFYTIKDVGENVFRIAPPCRSLTSDFAVYKKVHFGYGVQDTNNPDKIRARPFECIHKIDFKTKMVQTACPECTKIESMKAELESTREELAKQEGHPEDYIRQATSPQFDWLQQHNLDNKWYCYAKNLAGEWNVLKLGHRQKLAVDELIKQLKADGIDALSPSTGVWLKFKKNGLKGSKAMTTVEVLREKIEMNGQRVEIIKDAPLTDIDVAAIEKLTDVVTCVPKLTYEQINAIVESGGNPEVVAGVLAVGTKEQSPVAQQTAPAPAQMARPAPATVAMPKQQPATPIATAEVKQPAFSAVTEAKNLPTPTPAEVKTTGAEEFLRKFARTSK